KERRSTWSLSRGVDSFAHHSEREWTQAPALRPCSAIGGRAPGAPYLPDRTLRLQPSFMEVKRWRAYCFSLEAITSSWPSSSKSTKRTPLSFPSAVTSVTPAGRVNGSFLQSPLPPPCPDHEKIACSLSLLTINSQRPSLSRSRNRTPRSRPPS